MLEDEKDFLLVLLEGVDALGVDHFLGGVGEAPCGLGGAAVGYERHDRMDDLLMTVFAFSDKIRTFLLKDEVFIRKFHFFNASFL